MQLPTYNLSMISEKVQKEIDSARKFGEQLEDIVVSKNEFPTGDRNVLLNAYWALMFDYQKGILSLLQSEFSPRRSLWRGRWSKLWCALT